MMKGTGVCHVADRLVPPCDEVGLGGIERAAVACCFPPSVGILRHGEDSRLLERPVVDLSVPSNPLQAREPHLDLG